MGKPKSRRNRPAIIFRENTPGASSGAIESQIANVTLGRELYSRPDERIKGRQYNCRPNSCNFIKLRLNKRRGSIIYATINSPCSAGV
jgi:hypothetical protein